MYEYYLVDNFTFYFQFKVSILFALFAVLFDLDNRLICCTTNDGSLVVTGYEREGRTRNPNELINEAPSAFSMRADDDWLHFREQALLFYLQ